MYSPGDIVVKFGDRSDLKSETELIAYGLETFHPGDVVQVTVRRDEKNLEFELLTQP